MITIHTNANVLQVQNNATTTLSAGINASQTTIPLTNAAKFSTDGGYAVIEESSSSPVNEEVIYYSGKSGNTLTGVTRAVDGSTAQNGNIGDTVSVRDFAQHHNAVADAAKVTSQDLANLASGTEAFSTMAQTSAGAGSPSYTSDFQITGTTIGDTQFEFDLSADGSRLQIGRDQVEANQLAIFGRDRDDALDGIEFAGNFILYSTGNMQVSAQEGVRFEPDKADGAGAVPFELKSLNTITTGDAVFRVKNNGTTVLNAASTGITAPKFTATQAPGLKLIVFSADPSSPANGDMWFYENGGTREIRVRMSGITYGVAVT